METSDSAPLIKVISSQEIIGQICYDLGTLYFYKENIKKAKSLFEKCSGVQVMFLFPSSILSSPLVIPFFLFLSSTFSFHLSFYISFQFPSIYLSIYSSCHPFLFFHSSILPSFRPLSLYCMLILSVPREFFLHSEQEKTIWLLHSLLFSTSLSCSR